MYAIPRELVDAFKSGNASIFIGAGISMGAGLPNWAGLLKPLIDEIQDCPPESTLLDIAQYYAIFHGRARLIEQIERALDTSAVEPTEVHRALVGLPVRRFFTTNFDSLLETSFRERKVPFKVIVTTDHLAFWDESKAKIIKLHGDFDHPNEIVVTSEEYEDYFRSHTGIAEIMKTELRAQTVLFLGYSFNDINLRMILTRISRESRKFRRNLFTVQLNPSDLAIKDLERRGLRVIALQPEAGEDGTNRALCSWLKDLAKAINHAPQASEETASESSSEVLAKLINHNLPPRSADLLGRKLDFALVMEGLRSRYPLITIEGFAGIGKTSLAVEVGYACASSGKELASEVVNFEYVVWITAKDKPDQRRWLGEVLNVIAKTTDFSALTQRPFDEKKFEVERLLRNYKILLIVDNFETVNDPDLMAWLEQLPEPSKVVVTTRRVQLLQKAWAVSLKGMESTEALELLRQHAAHLKLEFIREVKDETLLELWKVMGGNPQAMKLALGLVHGGTLRLGQLIDQIQESKVDRRTDRLFGDLFERSWQQLSEPARQVLLMTPLLVGVSSIRADALQAVTGLPHGEFVWGLEQCRDASLLEFDHDQQRYVIHPLTRAFARKELDARTTLETAGWRRCSDYFLSFVREKIKRDQPEPRYWNALVSDGMKDIDPEWPSIQEVMRWADQEGEDERLIEFVLLLVHYMDSRFYNVERLSNVRKAIAALEKLNRKEDEALLRIDALGWTYVEEDRLLEAYNEVLAGYKIAEEFATQERDDLLALGLAWRARINIEQTPPDPERALRRIGEALKIDCQPWIRCRVNMAAGDIALKLGDAAPALTFYESAESEAQKYGGEGHGYQTLPRIGLAYLAMDRLDAAEEKFRELLGVKTIAIGNLYAEYGLAMVAYKRGDIVNARELIDDVKSKLSRGTTESNLLLKLIKSQEAQLPDLGRSA
jgi:tetratricopeptide (TPR) repeat protein